MGASDDDVAPWLPATRALLACAVAARDPDAGHLSRRPAAGRGHRRHGAARPRTARRSGRTSPRSGTRRRTTRCSRDLPMTPDVMHYHYDVSARCRRARCCCCPRWATRTRRGGRAVRVGAAVPHRGRRRGRPGLGAQRRTCPSTGRLGPTLDDAVARRWPRCGGSSPHRFVDVHPRARRPGRCAGCRCSRSPCVTRPAVRTPGPVRAPRHRAGPRRPGGRRAVHRRRSGAGHRRPARRDLPRRPSRAGRLTGSPGSSRRPTTGAELIEALHEQPRFRGRLIARARRARRCCPTTSRRVRRTGGALLPEPPAEELIVPDADAGGCWPQSVGIDPDAPALHRHRRGTRATVTGGKAIAALRRAYRSQLLMIAAHDLAPAVEPSPADHRAARGLPGADRRWPTPRCRPGSPWPPRNSRPRRRRPGSRSIAMGKCGAKELNYISDVDVIFAADHPPDGPKAERPDDGRDAGARPPQLATGMMRICGSPPGRSTRRCARRARPAPSSGPRPATPRTTSGGRTPGSSRRC